MRHVDILIVGAGAAGIAAAKSAYEAGCKNILLVERRKTMGGILLQCAHRGFGAQLTGVEYAERMAEHFPKEIPFLPESTVLEVTSQKTAVISGRYSGLQKISFPQLILAAGCLEVPMGALPIAGTRPTTGIFTAGQAQELMNVYHQIPKGPAVILGSGDLGLIMARQLAVEGVEIRALVEQRTSCGGMRRNQSCIAELNIPLICSSTVAEVFGEEQLSGVKIRNLLTGREEDMPCRSLLIAAGLRPDRAVVSHLGELDWLHMCGNCNVVHSMVETVAAEGRQAGNAAYDKIRNDDGNSS